MPPRKVSLHSLSLSFHELVCVDHFWLEEMCVFHAMDSVSRYSSGISVPDTSMTHAIVAFESNWISPFWAPDAVIFDHAVKNSIFVNYLSNHDVQARPIPPCRHKKNALESKQKIIRDIFLGLKGALSHSESPQTLFVNSTSATDIQCLVR